MAFKIKQQSSKQKSKNDSAMFNVNLKSLKYIYCRGSAKCCAESFFKIHG